MQGYQCKNALYLTHASNHDIQETIQHPRENAWLHEYSSILVEVVVLLHPNDNWFLLFPSSTGNQCNGKPLVSLFSTLVLLATSAKPLSGRAFKKHPVSFKL